MSFLKFNDNEIIKMTDLPRVVAESDVGSIANIQLWRKNKLMNFEVKLGELPEEVFVKRKNINEKKEEIIIESLNLRIGNIESAKGVIVVDVDSNSNLQKGDIITEVNRDIIINSDTFVELVNAIQKTGRNSLLLRILREEKSLWITIQFSK